MSAAAGVLLGTSVQSARMQAAETQAKGAQADADKARAARAVVNGLPAPGGATDPTLAALQRILQ